MGVGFFFLVGGSLTPFFFCENLLVRVKLGHPPNFNFLGKPPSGRKVRGRKPCVRTHYVRTKSINTMLSIINVPYLHPETMERGVKSFIVVGFFPTYWTVQCLHLEQTFPNTSWPSSSSPSSSLETTRPGGSS